MSGFDVDRDAVRLLAEAQARQDAHWDWYWDFIWSTTKIELA